MFIGYVKTKDIFLHPISLMQMRGLKGYLKLIGRALSRRKYSFIRMTQKSDWVFDRNVQKTLQEEARRRPSTKHPRRSQRTKA